MSGSIPRCKMCTVDVKWSRGLKKFNTYCSDKCMYSDKDRVKKRKQTCFFRYGVQDYTNPEKTKHTNMQKYGVDNPFKSQNIRSKIKDTILKKYGVPHHWMLPEIQKKIKQTNLKKYGTEWNIVSESSKQKRQQTLLKKYGIENGAQKNLWHGNPKIFDSDYFIVFLNKTAGELYQKTTMREKTLHTLNYNVVAIWESDWDNILKEITQINKGESIC
ncbi:MAG: DUF7487 domain-containing protein [Nitrosopumilaceae archaeon]